MKTETCTICSIEFGASLDDTAFGDFGQTDGLCESCQSELEADEVAENDR